MILFNGSILMSGLAFVMGFVATATMRILDKWGLATFYLQIITALLITLAAGAAQWLNGWLGWQVDTTMLVISGIVLLVAGLMIVGAFQDAIELRPRRSMPMRSATRCEARFSGSATATRRSTPARCTASRTARAASVT